MENTSLFAIGDGADFWPQLKESDGQLKKKKLRKDNKDGWVID